MNRSRNYIRLAVALFAAFTFIGVGSAAAQADETSVTIHKSTCPENTGADIFERCHDNALKGIGFDIAGTDVTTGSNGHATANVAAGSITITEDAGDTAGFKGAYVFCSEQVSGKVLTDGRVNGGSVTINTNEGDEIICDWYNLTAAVVITPTVGPSPTATATSVPVVHPTATSTPSTTTLPNTGAGNANSSSGTIMWIAGIVLALIAGAVTIRRRALN